MDLEQIEANYAKMETNKLLRLFSERKDLRKEVIPILQKELEKRGQATAVLQINESKQEKVKFENVADIDAHVNERLARGEMMESIVDDLNNKGVDLLSLALETSLKKEYITDEIFEMEHKGLTNAQIKKEINNKHVLKENEIEELQRRIRIKSKNNLIVGVLSIIGGILYLILGLSAGRLHFLSLGLIFFGISKLFLSNRQKRKPF